MIAGETGITPPALLNKPELDTAEQWLYLHFVALSRDRRHSESGPLPITIQEIYTFCQIYNEPFLESSVRAIQTLDDHYLLKAQEKIKRATSSKKGK